MNLPGLLKNNFLYQNLRIRDIKNPTMNEKAQNNGDINFVISSYETTKSMSMNKDHPDI